MVDIVERESPVAVRACKKDRNADLKGTCDVRKILSDRSLPYARLNEPCIELQAAGRMANVALMN